MLFHVEMTVNLHPAMGEIFVQDLKSREKELALRLQASGKWLHLWRVVGQYANVSVFDVESPAELHELLTALPLFPYMSVQVRALCAHPSALPNEEQLPRHRSQNPTPKTPCTHGKK